MMLEPLRDGRPDGDAVFVTAWHTPECVAWCAVAEGAQLYWIEHHDGFGAHLNAWSNE